jgi:hypothetical protein
MSRTSSTRDKGRRGGRAKTFGRNNEIKKASTEPETEEKLDIIKNGSEYFTSKTKFDQHYAALEKTLHSNIARMY